jgi:hypothetical protein
MHGFKCGSCRIWQRTDLPSDSNMLHRAAQTCSACKLAEVEIIPLPTLANQILARTFFISVALQLACPAVGKFSRASSAGGRLNLRSSIKQPDRVGRRGLSEPREDFSRLPTYANPWLHPWLYRCLHPWLYPWLYPWLDDLLHRFNGFQPHSAHLQAFRLTANIPYQWTEISIEHCQINFLKSRFHCLIHKWRRNQ